MQISHYYYNVCGIIGGVRPSATSYLFDLIIKHQKVNRDQNHITLLIYNNPQIPDRTEHLIYGKENSLPELIHSAKILKNSGATF